MGDDIMSNTLSWKNASAHGFSYYCNETISAGETYYLKMPAVTPNKRGINDIGFAYEDGITLYATLSEDTLDENTMWQEINPLDEVNKTISWFKIVNNGTAAAKINLRAILN